MTGYDADDEWGGEDADERADHERLYAEELERHPLPSSPFVRAAAEGDMDAVRRMIGEGVDVDQRDPGFKTTREDIEAALRSAGHDPADAQFAPLYESHIGRSNRDPRRPNSQHLTAMEMAVLTYNLPMLQLLHDAGADPCAPRDGAPSSLVQLALGVGFLDGLRYLVDAQKQPLKDEMGRNDAWLLIQAIRTFGNTEVADQSRRASSVDILRYLIEEKGIDPEIKTENGVTAANCANSINVPDDVLEYLYSIGGVSYATAAMTPVVNVRMSPRFADAVAGVDDGTGLKLFEEAEKLADYFDSSSTLLNESVFFGDVEKVRIHLKNGGGALVGDAKGINAYDVLDILKKQPDTAIYAYREKHDLVKAALDESLANHPRRKLPPPQP